MNLLSERTCEAQIDEPPWYLHTHTCGRPAKEWRDGRPVCGIHARKQHVDWRQR